MCCRNFPVGSKFLEISCFKGKMGLEWKWSGNFCSVWHLALGALGNCCGTSLQVTGSWNKDLVTSSLWKLLELSNPVPGSPLGSDHLNVPWICSVAPLLVRSMGSRTNWDLKQFFTGGVERADFVHSWVVSSSWSCFLCVFHIFWNSKLESCFFWVFFCRTFALLWINTADHMDFMEGV